MDQSEYSINLIAELGEATGDELLTNINPIGFGHLLKKIKMLMKISITFSNKKQ